MCFFISAFGLTCVNLKNIIQTRCSQVGGAVSWFGQLHYAHYTNFSFRGRHLSLKKRWLVGFPQILIYEERSAADRWLATLWSALSGDKQQARIQTNRNAWQWWFKGWHHVKLSSENELCPRCLWKLIITVLQKKLRQKAFVVLSRRYRQP